MEKKRSLSRYRPIRKLWVMVLGVTIAMVWTSLGMLMPTGTYALLTAQVQSPPSNFIGVKNINSNATNEEINGRDAGQEETLEQEILEGEAAVNAGPQGMNPDSVTEAAEEQEGTQQKTQKDANNDVGENLVSE